MTIIKKIDLSKFEKKVTKLNYEQFGSFPISLYEKVVKLAVEVNKKLGIPNVITISNKAKIKVIKLGKPTYEEVTDKGSIWYACSFADLKKYFITPLRILQAEATKNIRKLTKSEFLHFAFKQEFYFMYVGTNIEIVKNIRVDGGKSESEGICYKGIGQNVIYCLNFNDIKDDSSFNTGIENEIGYVYVNNSENI